VGQKKTDRFTGQFGGFPLPEKIIQHSVKGGWISRIEGTRYDRF
jgi:hypothetical protein